MCLGKKWSEGRITFSFGLGIFLRIFKIIFHVSLIERCNRFWTIMAKVVPEV